MDESEVVHDSPEASEAGGQGGAMAPIDFDGLGKWTEAEIDNLLQVVAPQIFEPSAASDDSKKEPKFTTDKSSKDQLSEGKAVRDLLFGHTVYFWEILIQWTFMMILF